MAGFFPGNCSCLKTMSKQNSFLFSLTVCHSYAPLQPLSLCPSLSVTSLLAQDTHPPPKHTPFSSLIQNSQKKTNRNQSSRVGEIVRTSSRRGFRTRDSTTSALTCLNPLPPPSSQTFELCQNHTFWRLDAHPCKRERRRQLGGLQVNKTISKASVTLEFLASYLTSLLFS